MSGKPFWELTLQAALCVGALIPSAPADAHEFRKINGYWTYFGWAAEPADEDAPNGPALFVNTFETDDQSVQIPATEAELRNRNLNDVQIEALYYGLRKPTDPSKPAARRKLGAMDDVVLEGVLLELLSPAKPGHYGFRVYGKLNGQRFDELFLSSEGRWNAVAGTPVVPLPRKDAWKPSVNDHREGGQEW